MVTTELRRDDALCSIIIFLNSDAEVLKEGKKKQQERKNKEKYGSRGGYIENGN